MPIHAVSDTNIKSPICQLGGFAVSLTPPGFSYKQPLSFLPTAASHPQIQHLSTAAAAAAAEGSTTPQVLAHHCKHWLPHLSAFPTEAARPPHPDHTPSVNCIVKCHSPLHARHQSPISPHKAPRLWGGAGCGASWNCHCHTQPASHDAAASLKLLLPVPPVSEGS
jgi:hypothetical protein